MRKTLFLFSWSLIVVCGWLWAADFWEKKPYTEWSEKEVNKMLDNSPWGDEVVVGDTSISSASPSEMTANSRVGRRGNRGGAAGGGDFSRARSVFVRLHTAAPIRMALARRAQLAGALSDSDAQRYIETDPAPGFVMIGLNAAGFGRRPFSDEEIQALKEKVYFELKKSKKRVSFDRLIPPERGREPEVYLYFPRVVDGVELFVPEEEEAKFVADLGVRLKVQVKFKLSKMIFDGRLEI